MKTTIFLFCIVFLSHLHSFSQELNWEIKEGQLNTGSSNVILSIANLDPSINANNVMLYHYQYKERIKASVMYREGNGIIVKLDIGHGPELVGEKNKLLAVTIDSMKILGHIIIPIGGNVPEIGLFETSANLEVDNPGYSRVKFAGKNFDGVINIISSGGTGTSGSPVSIKGIVDPGKSDSTLYVEMRSAISIPTNNTKYQLVYRTYDGNKGLKTITTDPQETYITLYRSSIIILHPKKREYLIEDVKQNDLILHLANAHNGNYTNYQPVYPTEPALDLNSRSSIDINGNDVIIRLLFNNTEMIKPGNYKFRFTRKEGVAIKEYYVQFTLLGLPEVTRVYTKSPYNKFLISKSVSQSITCEGSKLKNAKLVPANNGTFIIGEPVVNKDNEIEFPIQVVSLNMSEQKYSFDLVVENNIPIKTFDLAFEKPKMPAPLESLYQIKTTSAQRLTTDGPNKYMVDISQSKGEELIIEFDPAKFDGDFGNQSVTVSINYYNPDGKIISVGEPKTYEIAKGIAMKTFPISLGHDNEYVMLWGRAEIIISHSSDYYQQDLNMKNSKVLKIYFTKDAKLYVNAAFTIPPALLVYGRKNTTDKVEFLPINVGAGLRFSFVSKNKQGLNDYVRVGLYAAGINFVDRSLASGNEGDFIKQGDLAGMLLAEISLRRTDNFVKIPIFIGPGVTFPIQGASCRAFLAFGIGVTL